MNSHQPKLILHFDINKTILMCDSASGRASEEVLLADIVAGMCWGRVQLTESKGGKEKVWRCVSDVLSLKPPDKGLITYRYLLAYHR